jgi:hypothetical protein
MDVLAELWKKLLETAPDSNPYNVERMGVREATVALRLIRERGLKPSRVTYSPTTDVLFIDAFRFEVARVEERWR